MADFNTADVGHELGWDDEVKFEEFKLLDPGTYTFQVTGFQRKRHEGSQNLPPCPMAELTIQVDGKSLGKREFTHRLFLHSKTQGFLAAFFKSIGAPAGANGEVRMDWGKVPGATGLCEITINDFVAKDGSTKKNNRINKFVAPQPQQTGWQAGAF